MGDTSDQTQDDSLDRPQRPGLPEVALILIAGVLSGGLLIARPISPATLATTFYLALFIHIVASASEGYFSRWRTVTWLLLIVAWVVAEIAGFFAMITPWGQVSFRLSSTMEGIPLIGDRLSRLLAAWQTWPDAASVGYATLILLLVLDVLAMHLARWSRMSWLQTALLSAAAVAAAWILAPLIASLAPKPPPDGIQLFPYWYMLPLYALLRSVPDKLAGIVLVFGAMLVPLVLPWAGIDRLRGRLLRGLWLLLSVALAGCWFWLGRLGGLPPDDPALSAAPGLAGFHFAYFLVFPLLIRALRRYVRARREEATTVR